MTNLADLKAARVTLLNAAKRKDHNWWKLFARYAEIAKRKIGWIEIGIFVFLILAIGGCSKTMRGTGLIFEGFGDAIVAGGQHLQESANTGK